MPEPEALAAVSELAAELSFVMSTDEQRDAAGAIEDLSDEARYYGRQDWTTPENTPREVKRLILKAAKRYMKNPEGYTSSMAGDERVNWSDRKANPDEAGSATFSPVERQRLGELAGNRLPDFGSVGMFAFQRKSHRRYEGYVPTSPVPGSFPMFCNDEDPW